MLTRKEKEKEKRNNLKIIDEYKENKKKRNNYNIISINITL